MRQSDKGLASRLKDRIRIERPVTDSGFKGAGSGGWALVAKDVPAEVEDVLPSRAERLAEGINIATRPARVIIRDRPGITAAMRFVMGDRIMQIVAGPAVNNKLRALEFMVEDYSVAGNAA